MAGLTSFLKDFDLGAVLPDISSFAGSVKLILWLLMLAGPAVTLVLGLLYRFKPPKEANFSWGFRTYYGMGSVEAWRFTQRLAGICWTILGGALTLIVLILGIVFLNIDAGRAAIAAIWCVGVELVLIAACRIGLNVVVLKFYDKDGNRRKP